MYLVQKLMPGLTGYHSISSRTELAWNKMHWWAAAVGISNVGNCIRDW